VIYIKKFPARKHLRGILDYYFWNLNFFTGIGTLNGIVTVAFGDFKAAVSVLL
jgi:hypothetical protein